MLVVPSIQKPPDPDILVVEGLVASTGIVTVTRLVAAGAEVILRDCLTECHVC